MSLASKRAVPTVHAADPKDLAETSTFFATGTPPVPEAGSKPAPQASTPDAPKKPARTFFDTTPADPIFNLSTHRARNWSPLSEQERAARKEEQTQRARSGLEWMMSVLTR
jgi:hypothetical protein